MSDGFVVSIEDAVSDRLASAEATIRSSLASVAEVFASLLLSRSQQLASGDVLQKRSGALVASLHSETHSGPNGFVSRVSSDLPQAGILEYGGEIPAHEILPKDTKALRFAGSAGAVYAAAVKVPEVHIEEHSFLREALHEIEIEITLALVEEVALAVLAVLL